MANIRYAVIFHNSQTGLSKDDAVCVLHYEVGAPDTVEGGADDIHSAFNKSSGSGGPAGSINSAYNGAMTIKAYDGPGDPVLTKSYTTSFSGPSSPTEVALCLSYSGEGSAPKRQRQGRIYVPIGGTDFRPDTTTRARLIQLGQDLASVGNATFTTWKMYSPTSTQYIDVTLIWVDDAWDTQRRRGPKPTTRSTATVQ